MQLKYPNLIDKFKKIGKATGLIMLVTFTSSACILENDVGLEDNPKSVNIQNFEEPTPRSEIIPKPTPTLDFSDWYLQISEMQCGLELLDDANPGRFVAVCPEEVWLSINQITQVDVIVGEYCLDLKSAEYFADAIEKHFPGILQIEFVQIEGSQWGCYVPFSDTAGIGVVCGIGCEEIGIFLEGKTIRNYSLDKDNDSGGGSKADDEPPPSWNE